MSSDAFKIKLGNWLYRNAYPLYQFTYFRFKRKSDAAEIAMLQKMVKPGMVVYDIGANIGFYSLLLSDLAGQNGHIHSFEPEAVNYGHLKKNVRDRENVTANNLAAGASSGIIKIYKSPELNVDHRTYEPETYTESLEIHAVAIDDYNRSLPLARRKVDFIKMDIQGYEMVAIRGMHNVLETNPEIGLLSELWPYGLRTAGSTCSEYYETLTGLGLQVWLLENGGLTKLDAERVKALNPLGKEHYYNIYASKNVPQV
jgi:FkbM family methyltransferase